MAPFDNYYGGTSMTILNNTPLRGRTEYVTIWYSNSEPIDPYPKWGASRRLAKLDLAIAEFGKKVAMARHENMLWARALVLDVLRRLRRFGAPLLMGLHRPVHRCGRVCGESNQYRVMLC